MNTSQKPDPLQGTVSPSDTPSASDKYRTLVGHRQPGFCIIDVLFEETGQPLDYRFLEVNPVFEQLTGLVNVVGKTMRTLQPAHEQYWFDLYAQVVKTRQPAHVEQQAAHLAGGVWYEIFAFPFGLLESNQVAILFNDTTERKRQEQTQAFLLKLSDSLQTQSDPVGMQAAAMHLLGEHLGLSRAYYFRVASDQQGWVHTIEAAYQQEPDQPSLIGRHSLQPFGNWLFDGLDQGRVVNVSDVAALVELTQAQRAIYQGISAAAFLNVPLLRDGTYSAGIAVHSPVPRDWLLGEVALIKEVAARTWDAVERARAEDALRLNEQRTRIQNEAFQSAINGEPLASSLNTLTRMVKQQLGSDVRTAFYLADPDSASLQAIEGAGDMPQTCTGPMDGFPIGNESFGSGYALATGRPALTRDVLEDPLWQPYRQLASAHRFRACSSYPILTRDGKAVGSFTLYFTDVHQATTQEFALADAVTQAAAIILSRHTEALERTRAEEALRQSEARFRALATVGSSSVYFMSPDWCEMRRLDGAGFLVNTQEPTTGWIDTYIPPDERPRVRQAIERAISAKDVFELEHRVLGADGTVGWTFSRAIPLLDEAGQIAEWFGAATDVTARVKADQRFTRLFQASSAPFLVVQPEAPRFTITEVNDAYLAATMRTREEVVGQGIFEAFPDNPDDTTSGGVSALRSSLERVLASHQPDRLPGLKYDIARPDGTFEQRWWSPVNSPVLDENGQIEAIIHNANDVTQERHSQQALRESEARLQLALDAVQMGTFVWYPQDDRGNTDARTLALYGLEPADSLNHTRGLNELVLAADRAGHVAKVARALDPAGDGLLRSEYRILRASDGAERWIATLAQTQFAGEPPVAISITGVCADITVSKQAVAALLEKEERQAFLLKLSDALRPLSDSAQMERTAMQVLGQELGVNRAFFATIDADGESWSIRHDYTNGVTSHVGRYPMSQFQRSRLTQWQAGRMSSITDSETDSKLSSADRAAYAVFGTRAAIGVPLVKGGRFAALLSVNQTVPRVWTEAELALTSEAAERTWVAIERARALEALRESDERFRTLIQNLPDYAIFRIDPAGIITEWTEGAQRVKGYTAEEVVGQSIALFYTPEGLAAGELTTEIEQATQRGRAERESVRIRKADGRPDGERFWVNEIMTAIRDEEGRLVGFTKISRDITERKKADEALFDSRQRLQIVLDSIADHAIITVDPQNQIVSWNPGAQQMFGYTAEEAVGQSAAIIFTPEDRAAGQMEKEMDLARRQGQAPDERYHLRKDGSRLYVSGTQAPLYDADKTLLGYVKVARDLTDRQQMEQALRKADRRKNEFLAMLAHELRNPMATIRSGLQILSLLDGTDQTTGPPGGSATIAMMNRQTDHLVRMVDDLLDVSRISRGKIELKRERLELGSLVRAAVEAIRPQFDTSQKGLRLSPAPSALFVYGDATRLTQVVTNLLTNGLRYTDKQGQVWIRLAETNGEVLLEVTDNGIGLSQSQLTNIFELFVQADTSLARSMGGLGVGLTLAKRLVELHQGRLEASSPGLGQGSIFTVYLPLAEGPKNERLADEVTASSAEKLRLLVIDDNADAALTLSMLLTLKGYEVHSRPSGREGIQAAESLRPAVILCDIGMPELDGYATCRLIRGQSWGQSMRLIALTGYGGEEDKQRAQAAGFDGHLVKPVDVGVLQALLTNVLPTGSR